MRMFDSVSLSLFKIPPMSLQSTARVGISNNCLQVQTDATTQLIVKILDVQGRFITTIKKTVERGIYESCLNLDELAEGNYIVNTFSGDKFIRSFHYVKNTNC